MTKIFCTHKLQKLIGKVEQNLSNDLNVSRFGDWNSHLFFVDKRKCLIFTNNKTNYSIFLSDILKKDLKNLSDLFNSRLMEQLKIDKIFKQNNDKIITELGGQLTLYRTNNDRRIIGTMNDFIQHFKANCYRKYSHLSEMDIVYENGLINTIPTGKPTESKKTWTTPTENLIELLNNPDK